MASRPAAVTAGLPRRLAAMTYDALLLLALIVLFTILVMLLRGWREVDAGTVWFQLSIVALVAGFHGWFWTHGGQTLGMLAWKIRVERADGLRLSWRDAALRFCAAVLSLLPLGLGFWWSLVDSDKLAWHDRLSRTRIVRANVPSPGPQ